MHHQLHILRQPYNICINKLVVNLHITSHLKHANEHLPTQLAYAKKKLHCLCACLRTPMRTVGVSGQQLTQLYKEFPGVHEVGPGKKNDAQVNFSLSS